MSKKIQKEKAEEHEKNCQMMIKHITDDIEHLDLPDLGKIYKYTRKVIAGLK